MENDILKNQIIEIKNNNEFHSLSDDLKEKINNVFDKINIKSEILPENDFANILNKYSDNFYLIINYNYEVVSYNKNNEKFLNNEHNKKILINKLKELKIIKNKHNCSKTVHFLDFKKYFEINCKFLKFQNENCIFISLTDITKRIVSEKELIKKTTYMEATYARAFDSFFIFDLDYKIISFNKQAELYAKKYWKKNIQIGQSMREYTEPIGVWEVFKQNFDLSKKGKIIEDEQLITEGKHLKKWFFSTFSAVYSEKNKVVAISFVTKDITEKKEAELALKKSETTARAFMESRADAIALFDKDLNFIDLNKTMANNFKKPIEELKGQYAFDFINPKLIENRTQKIKDIFLNGIENRWIDERNNSWFDNVAFPIFDKDAKVESVALIARDITKLKKTEQALTESEEKFRSLVSNSTDAIRIIDETGKIIFTNDAHYSLTGFSFNEVKDQFIWEFLEKSLQYSASTQKILKQFKKIIIDKENIPDNPLFYSKIINKFGGVIDVQISIFEIDDGDKIKYGNIIRDISELKSKEKDLHELIATKDKFFNIIAHDLISPFNAILGFSSLLKDQVNQCENIDENKIIVNSLHESAENTYKLIENLLQWSRTQTGKVKYSPKNYSIEEIIKQAISAAEPSALSKKINIVFNLNDFIVFVDKFMIDTVLRNLLSNAVKFTKNKGVVAVVAKKTKNEAVISVIDNCVGIEQKRINSIFNIDKEYTTLGTNDENGTGLGLVLCKEFVLKNRGKIWVESKIDRGSSFSFSIPLAFDPINL